MSGKRIHSLDYLRGLAAFGIMIYHFVMFGIHKGYIHYVLDVSGWLERIAVYGVSIFYILSGLTLYLVYKEKDFLKFNEIKNFFIKRILRILPLFILVTLVVFIINKNYNVDTITTLFLNITGLFSILKPSGYIITGGWSIGNELFFYLFFPLIMILGRHKRLAFWGLTFIFFIIYTYFAFYIIDKDQALGYNWKNYINPFNQIFLFISGIVIGYITQRNATQRNATQRNATQYYYLLA